jgi:acyl carrier protein|tara:strand:+ start:6099 stop:6338 length:240 start_codon:yes stop_codon:yes gene_type:complete
MSDKVFSIVSKVFSISLDKITDESNPETIDSWDSFNGLILVDELENTFNVKFSLTEITDIKSVGNIKTLLINHGCELND